MYRLNGDEYFYDNVCHNLSGYSTPSITVDVHGYPVKAATLRGTPAADQGGNL